MECSFGGYVLNTERAELIGPDGPVHIERYPLNVLAYLIENADRVVTRDDLIRGVWGGRIVSDAAVSTAVKQARKAVGDTGAAQLVIRTVHGRGFRFVAALSGAKASIPAVAASVPKADPVQAAALGVAAVGGGHWCTVDQPSRFFSFRRAPRTGRMAAAIGITPR